MAKNLTHTGNLTVRNLQRAYKKLMSYTPKKKPRAYVWDTSIPGLGVRILNPSGTMTAIYRTRIYSGNGKSSSMERTIGRISLDVESLQHAIDVGISLFEKRSGGFNTSDLISKPRIIEEFYRDVYQVEHRDKCLNGAKKSSRTIQRDENIATQLIKRVGNINLNDPKVYDLFVDWRHEVVEEGKNHQTLLKATQLMQRIYRMGIRRGLCDHNYLLDFKNPPHKPRNMHIPPAEVAEIYKACLSYKLTSDRLWKRLADMFILKILLGTRSGELVDLTKQEVDLEKAIIIMSPERTKTHKSYRFKLSNMALDLLRNTASMSEPNNPLVFGIDGQSCASYLHEWHKILDMTGFYGELPAGGRWGSQTKDERVLTSEMKASRPRPHDLRHSFITNAREAGISREDVALAVQHSNTRTTELYEHMTDEIKSKVISAREASLVTALNQ